MSNFESGIPPRWSAPFDFHTVLSASRQSALREAGISEYRISYNESMSNVNACETPLAEAPVAITSQESAVRAIGYLDLGDGMQRPTIARISVPSELEVRESTPYIGQRPMTEEFLVIDMRQQDPRTGRHYQLGPFIYNGSTRRGRGWSMPARADFMLVDAEGVRRGDANVLEPVSLAPHRTVKIILPSATRGIQVSPFVTIQKEIPYVSLVSDNDGALLVQGCAGAAAAGVMVHSAEAPLQGYQPNFLTYEGQPARPRFPVGDAEHDSWRDIFDKEASRRHRPSPVSSPSHPVDQEVAAMRARGISDDKIRSALFAKYHPDRPAGKGNASYMQHLSDIFRPHGQEYRNE